MWLGYINIKQTKKLKNVIQVHSVYTGWQNTPGTLHQQQIAKHDSTTHVRSQHPNAVYNENRSPKKGHVNSWRRIFRKFTTILTLEIRWNNANLCIPVWRSRACVNWFIVGGTLSRCLRIASWRWRRMYFGHRTKRLRSRLGWISCPITRKSKRFWWQNVCTSCMCSEMCTLHYQLYAT